jgi:prolyl-tRNA synthetase
MKQSQLFTKTEKNFPKDEESVNAKYLIRAGYIRKSSAGIYSFLPLGLKVLNKINQIIREEMDNIGGQEALFPSLIAKKYWQQSGRWDVPVMYKLKVQRDEFGLGWTHEEIAASLAAHFIRSEKDLPQAIYQIQNKFRLEPRARSGLLRTREFLMKDLYSFHKTEADLEKFYKKVEKAYLKIFKRLSLPVKVVEASGGDFTKQFTHEFQTLIASGEDTVLYCSKCKFAQNKEIAKVKAGSKCPDCRGKVEESRAIEVGNIFRLGNRFSPWYMGSYGIGPSRTLATLVEVYHDDKGVIWPEAVAPYRVHLLELGKISASNIYKTLKDKGIEVLYDDRPLSPGEKFADADLIGIPYRLVVSERNAKKVEVKARGAKKTKLLTEKELIKWLTP